MRKSVGILVVSFVLAVSLPACSGSGFVVHTVPENGYGHTLNYQFQAQVQTDDEGKCTKFSVRVKALNKVYWKTPPPDRLQLFDDDCLSPVRFERAHFISRETRGPVQLYGPELTYFWSEQYRLEDELISWLWEKGII